MNTRYIYLVFLICASLLSACGGSTGSSSTAATSASSAAVVANAGNDTHVAVGATVTLDGSASTGVTSSSWTLTSKPSGSSASLSSATTLAPTFVADKAGDYVATLSVNSGASSSTVTITANTVAANISVPSDSLVKATTSFNKTRYVIDLATDGGTLSAANSQSSGALTYSWRQVSGPTATISGDTTSATLNFTSPTLAAMLNPSDRFKWQVFPISRDDTKMVFKLNITDASGNTDVTTFEVYLTDGGKEIHTQSGLNNIPVGAKTYLAGPNLKSATVAITDWTWTLTVPEGSKATFADSGTTTSTSEFPNFTPDVAGMYTIAYSSTTGNTTATISNVLTPGTILVNAADYVGVGTIGGTTPVATQCATCHDGTDVTGLGDKVTDWKTTKHSAIFENNMSTYAGLSPTPYLWQYHTVGYNTDADNSGFDDLAAANDFTFPAAGLTFADFTSKDADVAKLANVQCENCHGPGSEHEGDPLRIGKMDSNAGVCGQCHTQETEWANSLHNSRSATASSATGWATNSVCTRCHITKGFLRYLDGGEAAAGVANLTILKGDSDSYAGVTCVACHDPHNKTNDFQLRKEGDITLLADGSTVSAGKGAVCYSCHDGNRELHQTDCDSDHDGQFDTTCDTADQTATQYSGGGYHDTAQGPMLEGKQALTDLNGDGTDDFVADDNSFHSSDSFILSEVTGDSTQESTNNKCVTCHMATGPTSTEDGYQQTGGHAFAMEVDAEDTDSGLGADHVEACQPCHGSKLTEFNRLARADYDGDGTIEGIQDEVKGLLLNLSTLIKQADTTHINQNTDAVKTSATTGTSGAYTVTTATATEAVGDIHVGTISINGLSAFTNAAGTTLVDSRGVSYPLPVGKKCTDAKNSGIWTSTATSSAKEADLATKTYQGVRQCNFNAMSDTLKRAYWNYNSVVNDESLGIHNAGYAVQVLQGTYKAVGVLLGKDKSGAATTSSFTYKTDFPKATLRVKN